MSCLVFAQEHKMSPVDDGVRLAYPDSNLSSESLVTDTLAQDTRLQALNNLLPSPPSYKLWQKKSLKPNNLPNQCHLNSRHPWTKPPIWFSPLNFKPRTNTQFLEIHIIYDLDCSLLLKLPNFCSYQQADAQKFSHDRFEVMFLKGGSL